MLLLDHCHFNWTRPDAVVDYVCQSIASLETATALPFVAKSFHAARTVPPKQVVIKDRAGDSLHELIGPFDEGEQLKLICEATGGKCNLSILFEHLE